MRLIACLPVVSGRVVKSYGYRKFRPGPSLQVALESIDRWEADEILVLDISREPAISEHTLAALEEARIATPVAYGGGIRNLQHIEQLHSAGVERFVLETLIWTDFAMVEDIEATVGRQALIASIAMQMRLSRYALRLPGGVALQDKKLAFPNHVNFSFFSEALVIDSDNEGRAGRFSEHLIPFGLDATPLPIIWFGGLDAEKMKMLAGLPRTSGVAIGNQLFESKTPLKKIRSIVDTD